MTQFEIEFEGYFIDRDVLPSYAGIYLVYTGTYNKVNDKVTLHRLIYIGDAGDIRDRHANHERQADFEDELMSGEILIYATAHHADQHTRIQDALIYKLKPVLNTISASRFNHPETKVVSTGMHEFIPDEITAR